MIDIKFQRNNSENNKIGKSLTDLFTLSGVFKQEVSITDPVLLIESDLPINANYMTIAGFNRSYFIRSIRSVRTGLWEISAHVDVLESYKTQIKAQKAIIKKTGDSSKWNLYLNDGTFRVYQNPQIVTREFPGGFTGNLEYVLAVAGVEPPTA